MSMLTKFRIRVAHWIYPDVFGALETAAWMQRAQPVDGPALHHDTMLEMENRAEAGEQIESVRREILEAFLP